MTLSLTLSTWFACGVFSLIFVSSRWQAYLFKYDSTHGMYHGEVKVVDGHLSIDGNIVHVYVQFVQIVQIVQSQFSSNPAL